jgi:hypothetical protein
MASRSSASDLGGFLLGSALRLDALTAAHAPYPRRSAAPIRGVVACAGSARSLSGDNTGTNERGSWPDRSILVPVHARSSANRFASVNDRGSRAD